MGPKQLEAPSSLKFIGTKIKGGEEIKSFGSGIPDYTLK